MSTGNKNEKVVKNEHRKIELQQGSVDMIYHVIQIQRQDFK